VPARSIFQDFPQNIESWQGHKDSLTPDQLDSLKLTDYLMSDYSQATPTQSVNFYVAYYASQRRDAAPHSPLVCIRGSGWEIASIDSDYVVKASSLHVNRAIIKNGNSSSLVYFWFQERGRDLTTSASRKWYLFIDAFTKGRSDGALVRLVTPITANGGEAEADQALTSFLEPTLPLLKQYVPD
jgi:EpsI family protein